MEVFMLIKAAARYVFYFKDFSFDLDIYLGVFLNKTKIAQVCKCLSEDVLCTVVYNEKLETT